MAICVAPGKVSQMARQDRGSHRHVAGMDELAERIAAAVAEDGWSELLEGLYLVRRSTPSGPLFGVSEPTLCVVAQGSKVVQLGDSRFGYDPAHYLLATAQLPIVTQVVEATPELPFLGVVIHLDLVLVGSVMVESGQVARNSPAARAVQVSPLDAGLLDAILRLIRLADSPEEVGFMMPLIKREIAYRLLKGDQGDRLREIVLQGGHTSRIAQALHRIREDLGEPLDVEKIAHSLGMSPSSFYQHFRAVTGMSPLQYQKRLRLQEARQIMVGEGLNASSAARRVGYHDASHFSREYKSLFGEPPIRDVEQIRAATEGSGRSLD
jgi:AraC-like DNA-binding protein